jgi:hypothetical protein
MTNSLGLILQHNVLNSTVDTIGAHVKFSQSATYCITVEGHLDDSWTDRLGGMTITTSSNADQGVTTILEGRVKDQAELFGVLNTLYELHIPLLTVKILSPD